MDWLSLGFASRPELRISPASGLLVYRCWGARPLKRGGTEWGTGFFSARKPQSVLQAELSFNILDWNNGIHFVSTFQLIGGFGYWIGPVGHDAGDLRLDAVQIYVEQPIQVKLRLLKSQEVLRHDVFVSPFDGNAS